MTSQLISCPSCLSKLKLAAPMPLAAGTMARCPKCQSVFAATPDKRITALGCAWGLAGAVAGTALGATCGAAAGFGVALAAVGPPKPVGHGNLDILAYIYFPFIGGCIGAFIGGILGAIIVTIGRSSRQGRSAFGAMPLGAKNAEGLSVGEPEVAIIHTSTECEQAAGNGSRNNRAPLALALAIGGVVAAGLIGMGIVFFRESHDDTEVTAAPLVVIRGPKGLVDSLVFSPNGKSIATARNEQSSPIGLTPGDVRIWDSTTGEEVQSFHAQKNQVSSVEFSPDGTRLAGACGEDKTVKVWDVQTGKEVLDLSGHRSSVTILAYSPDGKRIASAGPYISDLRIWDANSGKLLLTLSDNVAGVNGVGSLAFSPDGWHFAVSRAQGIRVEIWDLNTAKEVRAFSGCRMMFSPDGHELSMKDKFGKWSILDVATWEKKSWALPTLENNALVIRPDWQHFAALLYKRDMATLKVLDPATGRPLYSFTHLAFDSATPRLAFSLDGDRVAAGTGLAFAHRGENLGNQGSDEVVLRLLTSVRHAAATCPGR